MVHEEEVEESIKALSKERFGKYAAGYVNSTTHAKQDELSYLVTLVSPSSSCHMLDVATGGGHTALAFAPYVDSVIASDITPQMLAQAQTYILEQNGTNVRYKLVDAICMPFDAETFDLVTCRIAAHHFSDAVTFVQEANRVLKPGGTLLVQDQVMPEDDLTARYIEAYEKLRDPSHNRAYSETEWQAMLTGNGFDVKHSEIISRHHNFMEWTERQKVTANTIDCLNAMALSAPDKVIACLQPHNIGTEDAEFYSQHIIIIGQKQ